MRNHIIVKFIAVLLCTITLLGSVGSAAGLYIMSEADLYNKTADQVRDELIWERGATLAHEAAQAYASQALGGCPEEMTDQILGDYWKSGLFHAGRYGYQILDAEGNEVFRQGQVETGTPYRFPVEGQYLHLVSMETQQEAALREAQERASQYGLTPATSISGVEIPPEGIIVTYASFVDPQGELMLEAYFDGGMTQFVSYSEDHSVSISETGPLGYLFLDQEGYLVFRSVFTMDTAWQQLQNRTVGIANFFAPGDVSLTLQEESTIPDYLGDVGYLYIDEQRTVIFTSEVMAAEAPGETVPQETVLEAMLETASETVPETTVSQALADVTVLNQLPQEGAAISYAVIYDDAGKILYEPKGDVPVGFLFTDETGALTYASNDTELLTKTLADRSIFSAAFYDLEGNLVYLAACPDGILLSEVPATLGLTFLSLEDLSPTQAREKAEETTPEETAEETQVPEETASSPSQIPDAAQEETVSATEPVIINGKHLSDYPVQTEVYMDPVGLQHISASYIQLPMPAYTVALYLAPDALPYEDAYTLLEMLRENRHVLLPALAICLLLFAICAVYLCTAAGHKPGSNEIRAGGLNRMSLDVYLILAVTGIGCACAVAVEAIRFFDSNIVFLCLMVSGMAFLCCLIFVAFCYAFVAQVKTPGGYWWNNTLCARCLKLFIRFALWLEYFLADKFFPFCLKVIRKSWKLFKAAIIECCRLYMLGLDWTQKILGRFFRWNWKLLHRFFSLLPITWQWLLTGFVIIFIAALTMNSYSSGLVIFGLLAIMAILLYGSHCFGVLSESTRNMSHGNLETKVDDKLLLGCFKDFASDLNDLADVAVVAAQKQLKSERMKTELITNVSHDIKTPLTSIINYVDLLQKPHTEADQAAYLEVLDRQSQRLKKLIDDLMEMSKASTGNMTVEITTLDAVESVNQALGEFADKLAAARLTPMFRHSQDQVPMMADGKLVWRVLSNLLTNAVKYAMPGTRLYVDLMELEGKVILSLKNISRDELNIDADELMERFVRGDDSRNTEGSGLGLNIAKSLMELQKGQLQLLVDGDLFKVTLIFPGA